MSADRGLTQAEQPHWQQRLSERLPLLGHRNWVVIADSAYPLQSREGIETIATGEEQVAVLKHVLAALNSSKHVRPIIHLDAELPFVAEQDAPGISAYRNSLTSLLKNQPTHSLPHEEIISKLDKSAQTFNVLILKTNMRLPYTSVFIELDCGYWSAGGRATSAGQDGAPNSLHQPAIDCEFEMATKNTKRHKNDSGKHV